MQVSYPLPGVAFVHLQGDVDDYNSNELWAVAYPFLTNPSVRWALIDLVECRNLGSSAMALISWFDRHLRRRGGGLMAITEGGREIDDLARDNIEFMPDVRSAMAVVLPRLIFPLEVQVCLAACGEPWGEPSRHYSVC
jgi:hypothetical protein